MTTENYFKNFTHEDWEEYAYYVAAADNEPSPLHVYRMLKAEGAPIRAIRTGMRLAAQYCNESRYMNEFYDRYYARLARRNRKRMFGNRKPYPQEVYGDDLPF